MARLQVRPVAATTTALSGRARPSILGTTVGLTLGSATLTLIAWPLADIFLAPSFIKAALLSEKARSTATNEYASLRALHVMTGNAEASRVCMVAGGTHEQCCALAHAAGSNRPILRLPMRQATTPFAMIMSIVDGLYGPLACAPLLSCVGVVWVTLFDMLIVDHEYTRHRDLFVLLRQAERAMELEAKRRLPSAPRPLVIVENVHVPLDAVHERGGEGLSPMLRTLQQWLCKVSLDGQLADVLILAPSGSATGKAACNKGAAWRGAWRAQAPPLWAERVPLGDGVVAVALTHSEAVERAFLGCRLRG